MFTLPVQSNVKAHIAFICSSQILLSVLKACHFRESSFVRKPFTCGVLVAPS